MVDANPNTGKRARAEVPASGSGSPSSSIGKGVTEQMSHYAAPLIQGIKEALTARAINLRIGAKKADKAAEALETANREGKIVRSLEFKPSSEQKRLFPKVSPELQDQLRRLSQAMQMEALKERRDQALLRRQEYDAIVNGAAFTTEANAKLDPSGFRAHPSAEHALKELIRVEQVSFHIDMAIKIKQLEAKESVTASRRTHEAERSEQVRMQVEQQETSVTLKRFVAEEFRKAKAGLIKEVKASLNASPPKHVHFKKGDGKRSGDSQSRGRSKSRSTSRSRSDGRRPGGRASSSRGRSATPKRPAASSPKGGGRGRSKPPSSRSSPWGNGRGDRGHTSRRPPSGTREGSGRVGGGGGSKTGRRR